MKPVRVYEIEDELFPLQTLAILKDRQELFTYIMPKGTKRKVRIVIELGE